MNTQETLNSQSPAPVRVQSVVKLRGWRVKLKNRRVEAAVISGDEIGLKWVRLHDGDRKEIAVKLTPEAAAATIAVLTDALGQMHLLVPKEAA